MEAGDSGRRNADYLPARSRASMGRHDSLRPLRGEGANARSKGGRSSAERQAASHSRPARLPSARPTTRQIAAAFIRLCQQPTRALSAWLADDSSPGRRTALPGAFRQTAKQTARGRPRATAAPAGSGRGAAAYQAELANWQPLIDAAATDPSLSREQRSAAIASLRVRQQIAAAAVRNRVTEEERQTAKEHRRITRQQSRRFTSPDPTP
jgi:hypothetical protein